MNRVNPATIRLGRNKVVVRARILRQATPRDGATERRATRGRRSRFAADHADDKTSASSRRAPFPSQKHRGSALWRQTRIDRRTSLLRLENLGVVTTEMPRTSLSRAQRTAANEVNERA
ncbi:hypothetical protein HPB50_003117 [Hyalomma asiaticum]|uniref:Uncharacterized protein n=1 Tax=Hyalomma asiaticum TaxID=266040 RepID=A0ACB7S4F6_HYAAI|nr:hypothetical protein HPB50_003117 [Hyalomma asiaticum]